MAAQGADLQEVIFGDGSPFGAPLLRRYGWGNPKRVIGMAQLRVEQRDGRLVGKPGKGSLQEAPMSISATNRKARTSDHSVLILARP